MEVTIYLLEDEGIKSRKTCFPCKTEATVKKHVTSIYGSDNMDKVEWDIIEPEEEEGSEEIEEPETEIGSYLKRKMRRKK